MDDAPAQAEGGEDWRIKINDISTRSNRLRLYAGLMPVRPFNDGSAWWFSFGCLRFAVCGECHMRTAYRLHSLPPHTAPSESARHRLQIACELFDAFRLWARNTKEHKGTTNNEQRTTNNAIHTTATVDCADKDNESSMPRT